MMWFPEALTAYKLWSQDPDPELATHPLALPHCLLHSELLVNQNLFSLSAHQSFV